MSAYTDVTGHQVDQQFLLRQLVQQAADKTNTASEEVRTVMTAPPIIDTAPAELLACPRRFTLFVAWAARRPRWTAIWQTTALFGGAGCSLLHVHNATQAAFTYLLGFYVAVAVMAPWFLAEYRINEGRLR